MFLRLATRMLAPTRKSSFSTQSMFPSGRNRVVSNVPTWRCAAPPRYIREPLRRVSYPRSRNTSSTIITDLHTEKHDRSTTPQTPRSYAFVEFRSQRHAEDAYFDMCVLFTYKFDSTQASLLLSYRHGRNFEGSRLSIQVCFRWDDAN
jgi:hypothetical protein